MKPNKLIEYISYDNFFLYLSQSLSLLSPLILFPFLTNIYGSENFGLLMFGYSYSLIISIFVEYGFYLSAQKELQKTKSIKKKNFLINNVLNARLALSFATFIIFFIIGLSIKNLNSNTNFLLLSVLLGILIGNNFQWYWRGIGKFVFGSILEVIAKLSVIFFSFILIEDNSSIFLYFDIFITIMTGLFFVNISLILYSGNTFKVNFPSIRNGLLLGKKLFAIHAVGSLYINTPVFLTGLFFPLSEVGIFSVAEKIVRIFSLALEPLKISLFPKYNKLFNKNDRHGIYNSFKFDILLLSLFSIFISVILLLSSKYLILEFFHKDFLGALNYIKVLFILPILITFNNALSHFLIIPSNNESFCIPVMLLVFFLNIIMFIILYNIFNSFIVIAYSILISETLIVISYLIFSKKFLRYNNLG